MEIIDSEEKFTEPLVLKDYMDGSVQLKDYAVEGNQYKDPWEKKKKKQTKGC